MRNKFHFWKGRQKKYSTVAFAALLSRILLCFSVSMNIQLAWVSGVWKCHSTRRITPVFALKSIIYSTIILTVYGQGLLMRVLDLVQCDGFHLGGGGALSVLYVFLFFALTEMRRGSSLCCRVNNKAIIAVRRERISYLSSDIILRAALGVVGLIWSQTFS